MNVHLDKIKNILFDYGNTLVLDPFRSILELQAQRFISLFKAKSLEIKKGARDGLGNLLIHLTTWILVSLRNH